MYTATGREAWSEYPSHSDIAESDWHVLAGFWHPVAFCSEVQDAPFSARLLDVDLVVYRTNSGVAVARDLCVHRGAKLSLGWLDEAGDCVICPFHGLHYDSDGQCTKIPSLTDQTKKPPKTMKLRSFLAEERYGIIWACLKPEPLRPLPEWSILEDHGPEWLSIQVPKGRWATSAGRHCENFNDIAHLSWVHMKTFGNRNRPEVPDYELTELDNGLRMALSYMEVERGFNDDLGERERETGYVHELTFPFATSLRCDYSSDEPDEEPTTSYFFDIGSPVSARTTEIYQITLTNIPGATAEDYVDYQLVTNEEDIVVVESQRPEDVPLNLAAEIHIPADKFTIRYRRELAETFGLGADT